MVDFRQVQAAQMHNTLCPVCCDWFFADPELESTSPEYLNQVPKEGSPYTSWDLSIYRQQLPSLLLSNSCERPLCTVGVVFQGSLPLSGGQAAFRARCSRLWGDPPVSGVLWGGLEASRGGHRRWRVDPYVPG